jgi:hypothetical protein
LSSCESAPRSSSIQIDKHAPVIERTATLARRAAEKRHPMPQVSRGVHVTLGRYGRSVTEDWWVTIRGQTRKFVTCEKVAADGEFLAFLDHSGALLLLVRRSELIAMERYEEPPF